MRTASIASVAVSGGFHDGDWVESKDQDPDGDIRLLQLADVGDGGFRDRSDRRVNQEAFDRLNCSPVRERDVLIARMPDPLGRACLVPRGIGRAITVVDVAVLRCDESRADPRFVMHAINAGPTRSLMASFQDGATRQRIPRKRLGRVRVPLPSLDQQRAIADYLDRETARIDMLIEEQQRLIEMLRERRLGVVRAGVTGLLSGGKRGTSDTWFGTLPDDWTSARIRYDFTVILGKMINASKVPHEGTVDAPYLAAGSIQPEALVLDDSKRMVFTRTEMTALDLQEGDVVVVEGGAGYGRSHYLRHDLVGWGFQNHVARLRPSTGRVDGLFATYCLKTCLASGYIEANNRTATLPSLSRDVLGSIQIPVPPMTEQRRIAKYLDEQTTKIDALIVETERFIELSRERRSALISAAVTGQIDLREVV